ncbi:MAG: hypothetical protein PHU12_02400 [Candidatus Aenigmarchaeota archaeon]|nr:hypothetical protein [Candidatus Aenigmarchaeota archaeon]
MITDKETILALTLTIISLGVMYLFRGIDMINTLFGIKENNPFIIIAYIIAGIIVCFLGFLIWFKSLKIDRNGVKLQIKKIFTRYYYLIIFLIMFLLLLVSSIYLYLIIPVVEINNVHMTISISLITTFLGILLTVFLVTFLLERREKIRWNCVENIVYEILNQEINDIYTDISNFIEGTNPVMCIPENIPENDEEKYINKIRFEAMKAVANKDTIEINDVYKKYIINNGFGKLFMHRKEKLDSIETKYSKFLEPELVRSLIIIQDALDRLDINSRIKEKDNTIIDKIKKKEIEETLLPMTWFKGDQSYLQRMAELFRIIIKEIYNIYVSDTKYKFSFD